MIRRVGSQESGVRSQESGVRSQETGDGDGSGTHEYTRPFSIPAPRPNSSSPAPDPPSDSRLVMRIAIVGNGRMGKAVVALATERGHIIHTVVDSSDNVAGRALTRDRLRGADVAVEFTRPDAAPDNLRQLLELGIPTVTGTTGWTAALPRDLRAGRGPPRGAAACGELLGRGGTFSSRRARAGADFPGASRVRRIHSGRASCREGRRTEWHGAAASTQARRCRPRPHLSNKLGASRGHARNAHAHI